MFIDNNNNFERKIRLGLRTHRADSRNLANSIVHFAGPHEYAFGMAATLVTAFISA